MHQQSNKRKLVIADTALKNDSSTYTMETTETEGEATTESLDNKQVPISRYADINMAESERLELASVIYLEAHGEPAEGQQAVAEVVFNRVISPDFPKTIHDVLHQGETSGIMQFTSITKVSQVVPTEEQYRAIDAALYGNSIIPVDVLYFSINGENEFVWGTIGNHVFCYGYQ